MKLGPALLLLTCCVSHGVSVDGKRTAPLSSTAGSSGNSSSTNSKSENVSGRRSAAPEGRSESSALQVESSKRHINAQLPFGLNIPHGSQNQGDQPNYAFAPVFGGGFRPAANGAGPFGVKFDRGQALFPGRNGRLDPGIDQSFSTGHNGNQFSDQGLIPPVGPGSDADGTSPPVLAAVPGGRPRPDGSSRAKVTPIELFPSPDVVTVTDIEKLGDAKLERTVRGYYDSGADREQTLRENVEAFSRLRFRPRVLVDVSRTSTSTTVLGREISMPIGIAPSAMQKLADPIGEVGTAKAAEAAGTVMILSTLSTTSLEEVRKNAPNCLLWYQLYVYRNRSLTESLVKRAAKAGYSALVLTVDAPVFGLRIADVKNRFSLPPGLKLANLEGSLSSLSSQSGSGLTEYTSRLFNPSVTWEDVPWLRSISGLPVVIKGIVTPEAAVYAQTYGAAAVLVSNHGGRQLDGAPATIEALPEIVAATRGRMEVYMDGGVRSGADAVKALCLGARAVFVGRPALWGLAYNGTEGVARMLDILRSEFERTIALLGVPDSTKLTPRYVVREEYYSQLNWRNFPRQEL